MIIEIRCIFGVDHNFPFLATAGFIAAMDRIASGAGVVNAQISGKVSPRLIITDATDMYF